MTTYTNMPSIEAAIDEESYDFLETSFPQLAAAVGDEVKRGRTPDQIRRFVYQATNGRNNGALADRCEQAARHLHRQNGGGQ